MGAEEQPGLELAKAESRFRFRILEYLGATLTNRETPASVKNFILLILFLLAVASFLLCIMVVDLLYSAYEHVKPTLLVYCFYGVSGDGLIGAAFAIPLVARMNSLEEAQRLEERLTAIKAWKETRYQRRMSA